MAQPATDPISELFNGLSRVMRVHFESDGDHADFLADRLLSRGILNPYEVFDRPKDLAALRRIDAALLEITRAMSDAAMTDLARFTLSQSIMFGEFLDRLPLASDSADGKALTAYLDHTGKPDAAALTRIEDGIGRMRAAVARASRQIEKSPRAKKSAARLNADAVGLVDACRFVWELATEKPAPKKDLNAASPFGHFLADVFEVCGVAADPRSAFLAWAREYGQIHTSPRKIVRPMDD